MYIGFMQETLALLKTPKLETKVRVEMPAIRKEAEEIQKQESKNTVPLPTDFYSFPSHSSEDIYEQLASTPDTTISLPYDSEKFLSFKVYEASQGAIVRQDKNVVLRCQIRGTTYTLTRDHLDLLSNGERRDLFNYLGIDSRQLY